MALTLITVTGPFLAPGGDPETTGTVTATLSQSMLNGADVVEPDVVVGYLNAAGHLTADDGLSPFLVYANTDPGTSPADTFYAFTVQIGDAPLKQFQAVVPFDAPLGAVTLADLERQT